MTKAGIFATKSSIQIMDLQFRQKQKNLNKKVANLENILRDLNKTLVQTIDEIKQTFANIMKKVKERQDKIISDAKNMFYVHSSKVNKIIEHSKDQIHYIISQQELGRHLLDYIEQSNYDSLKKDYGNYVNTKFTAQEIRDFNLNEYADTPQITIQYPNIDELMKDLRNLGVIISHRVTSVNMLKGKGTYNRRCNRNALIYCCQNNSNNIDVFSINEHQWVNNYKSTQRIPQECLILHLSDNKFLLSGGIKFQGTKKLFLKDALLYKQNIGFKLNSMQIARFSHSGCILGQYVYIVGGYEGQYGHTTRQCEKMHLPKKRWQPMGSMNIRRAKSSVCSFDNKFVYCFGGINGYPIDSIQKYDVAKEAWELSTLKLPTANLQFGTLQISEDQVLIMGGLSSEENLSFNMSNGNYAKLTPMIKGGIVMGHPLVVDGIIYLTVAEGVKKRIEIFNIFTNQWWVQQMDYIPPKSKQQGGDVDEKLQKALANSVLNSKSSAVCSIF